MMADNQRICSVGGCGNPSRSRGWCPKHYARWLQSGDPLALKKTPNGEALRFFRDVVSLHQGSDCLAWPYARSPQGYGRLFYGGKYCIVSRLACEIENGPAPSERLEAAHSCGNGRYGCVSRKHMRWATTQENAADKFLHGSTNRGQSNGNARLSADNVRAIRALASHHRLTEIAAMFGVSASTIGQVQRGSRWGWLE